LSGKLSLKVEPRAEELDTITVAVEEFGDAEQWPPDLIFRVNLVLEEVGLNIINHGRTDDLHEIEITLTSEAESLTIEIVDNGRPFDPLTDAPEPDLDSGVAERAVGGLGVYLVRTMMDELRYRREGDRNYLTLIKGRVE
jgi:anti-sigma regulatory factor (Ser/Thr protein kinase)